MQSPVSFLPRCLIGVAAWLTVCASIPTPLHAAPGRVGVVDRALLRHEPWMPHQAWTDNWPEVWASERVVESFRARGMPAEVIGVDALENPERLRGFKAIMVPGDHVYPDEGGPSGTIARNLGTYVKNGGVYILGMGVAHHQWREVKTGAGGQAQGVEQPDFLGLRWMATGNHEAPGAALKLTPLGEKTGLPVPSFTQPVASYVRAARKPDAVYATNDAKEPCLYLFKIGNGAAVHYAGGFPLDAAMRDWLVGCYAAILNSGPDLSGVVSNQIYQAREFSTVPVAARPAVQGSGAEQPSAQLSLAGQWETAQAPAGNYDDPATSASLDWNAAPMPNPIQWALFLAGRIPNPFFGSNHRDLQWIHQSDWFLRTRFRVPDGWAGRRIRLQFDGMDYLGAVWLDGRYLGTHEGMFGGPTFDLTGSLEPGSEHTLLVRLMHDIPPGDVFKSSAVHGTNYIWANKYRTIGLWQPVRLVATGAAWIEAPLVRTDRLREHEADLWAQTMIFNAGEPFSGTVRAAIVDAQTGAVVWTEEAHQQVPASFSYWERAITLPEAKLWWPNGYGEQPLYRLELTLARGQEALDRIDSRFGVRTIELKRNPYRPERPRANVPRADIWPAPDAIDTEAMATSDESARFLFVVNGRPIFCKGACWMTSDDLNVLDPRREAWLMRAAHDAGLNLYRLNGGTNLFETEQFFNLCDEFGILVWQDLPFHWMTEHGGSRLVWREQLTQTVLRLRQHPSLALWVGGNEFGPYFAGMDVWLGLGRQIIDANDSRPFRMSSPGGGTVHAYYTPENQFEPLWAGDPNWYARYFAEDATFISEWSYTCYANGSFYRRMTPPAEFDTKPVGYDAAAFLKAHPTIHDRFGEVDRIAGFMHQKASRYGDLDRAGLDQFLEYAQLAQAAMHGCIFEQWRGQFPYKGGETVWAWNNQGPSAGWGIIDWFGQPQAAYYAVRRANEPVHAWADCGWFTWGAGDTFTAQVTALSDRPEPIAGAGMRARLFDLALRPVLEERWSLDVPAGGVRAADREVAWTIPADSGEGCFFLEVTLDDLSGARLSQRVYPLRVDARLSDTAARAAFKAKAQIEPFTRSGWLHQQLAALPTTLEASTPEVQVLPGGIEAQVRLTIENTGERPAWPVHLALEPDTHSVLWDDDYFWLAPGERREITGRVRLDMSGLDPITNPPTLRPEQIAVMLRAWNDGKPDGIN